MRAVAEDQVARLHQRLACLRRITRSVYGLRGRLAQRDEIQRLDLPLAGSRLEERSHLLPGDEQAHQALRPGDKLTQTLRGQEYAAHAHRQRCRRGRPHYEWVGNPQQAHQRPAARDQRVELDPHLVDLSDSLK